MDIWKIIKNADNPSIYLIPILYVTPAKYKPMDVPINPTIYLIFVNNIWYSLSTLFIYGASVIFS